MQRFAEWITTSRARGLVGAALLALPALILLPFGSWLPGALVVLLAVHAAEPVRSVAGPTEASGAVLPRGTQRAAQVAPDWLAALVAAVTLWWLLQPCVGAVPAALVTAALVLPPYAMGRLLARGGSLNLTFQLAILAALLFLGVVHLRLEDPPAFWQPLLDWFATELDRMGAVIAEGGRGTPTETELLAASASRMWGVATWLMLLNTMVAAFVGLWWSGLLARQARLGPAFRLLKAGRTLAIVAVAVLVLTFVARSELAADATWVFLGAFVLQGLAVLHALSHGLGLGTGWLVATYVLLFFPLTTAVMASALALFGFIDNWYPLRERLPARDRRGPG